MDPISENANIIPMSEKRQRFYRDVFRKNLTEDALLKRKLSVFERERQHANNTINRQANELKEFHQKMVHQRLGQQVTTMAFDAEDEPPSPPAKIEGMNDDESTITAFCLQSRYRKEPKEISLSKRQVHRISLEELSRPKTVLSAFGPMRTLMMDPPRTAFSMDTPRRRMSLPGPSLVATPVDFSPIRAMRRSSIAGHHLPPISASGRESSLSMKAPSGVSGRRHSIAGSSVPTSAKSVSFSAFVDEFRSVISGDDEFDEPGRLQRSSSHSTVLQNGDSD